MREAGISVVVDGTLRFTFERGWLVEQWDSPNPPARRHGDGRRKVDLVAVRRGRAAQLVEAKDDRVGHVSGHSREPRSLAQFAQHVAGKFADSVQDALDDSRHRRSVLAVAFGQAWSDERTAKRVVLWWERGAHPPTKKAALRGRTDQHRGALLRLLKPRLKSIGLDVRAHVLDSEATLPRHLGFAVRTEKQGVAVRRAASPQRRHD